MLDPETYAPYIDRFNTMEEETVVNAIPNARAWDWMKRNIPLFECPDRMVEETYYYRWWTYRKHIKETPAGFVLTEFLTPVKHAGAFNTISCALGHHIAEGRWLREGRYLDDYIRFWFRGDGGRAQPHFHRFSGWAQTAVYERFLVNGDRQFATGMLDDLVSDYRQWEREQLAPDGLFWQFDVRDGMEESISGSRRDQNRRPTINSYMYGNARAIASLARLADSSGMAREFDGKADDLKRRVGDRLWDDRASFYKVRLAAEDKLSDAREALGFLPWRFGLADARANAAWAQFTDTTGFRAPFGITTAERRHPRFRSHGCCQCEWDGAVWPFATSQTLDALAKVLRGKARAPVARRDYMDAFLTYVRSQRRDGKPYIGEYLDETNGRWLKGDERSRYYNHSTFADLVITGIVGLVPGEREALQIDPMLPEGVWDWFCLDAVPCRGRLLTILWDATGRRYGRGAGLQVFADGNRVARSPRLTRLTV